MKPVLSSVAATRAVVAGLQSSPLRGDHYLRVETGALDTFLVLKWREHMKCDDDYGRSLESVHDMRRNLRGA